MSNDLKQQTQTCIHRFLNGDSALVKIEGGKCRCELCNIEVSVSIVDDSYEIHDEETIIEKIKKINLEEVLEEEENL